MKDERENLRKAIEDLRNAILQEAKPFVEPFIIWVEKQLRIKTKEEK